MKKDVTYFVCAVESSMLHFLCHRFHNEKDVTFFVKVEKKMLHFCAILFIDVIKTKIFSKE
jgi:hypothetical protein